MFARMCCCSLLPTAAWLVVLIATSADGGLVSCNFALTAPCVDGVVPTAALAVSRLESYSFASVVAGLAWMVLTAALAFSSRLKRNCATPVSTSTGWSWQLVFNGGVTSIPKLMTMIGDGSERWSAGDGAVAYLVHVWRQPALKTYYQSKTRLRRNPTVVCGMSVSISLQFRCKSADVFFIKRP